MKQVIEGHSCRWVGRSIKHHTELCGAAWFLDYAVRCQIEGGTLRLASGTGSAWPKSKYSWTAWWNALHCPALLRDFWLERNLLNATSLVLQACLTLFLDKDGLLREEEDWDNLAFWKTQCTLCCCQRSPTLCNYLQGMPMFSSLTWVPPQPQPQWLPGCPGGPTSLKSNGFSKASAGDVLYAKKPMPRHHPNLWLICHRVTSACSFSSVQVDYAGPFLYKEGIRRKSTICKGYVAVYVCFSTKAVFLDLVCDLMGTYGKPLSNLRRLLPEIKLCGTMNFLHFSVRLLQFWTADASHLWMPRIHYANSCTLHHRTFQWFPTYRPRETTIHFFRKIWKYLQFLTIQLWRRWREEYNYNKGGNGKPHKGTFSLETLSSSRMMTCSEDPGR